MDSIKKKLTIKQQGDTTTAVLKVDGEVVKQAQVTRFHGDADDFLTAAEFAIKKLREEPKAPQRKYKVGDKVRVHLNDDSELKGVVKGYKKGGSIWPYIITLSTGKDIRFSESKESFHPYFHDYIIGLAEEPAAASNGSSGAPSNVTCGRKQDSCTPTSSLDLKPGDKVYTYHGNFVGDILEMMGTKFHLKYTVGGGFGYVWRYLDELVGKIVPCGKLQVGDEVLMENDQGRPERIAALAGKVVRVTDIRNGFVGIDALPHDPHGWHVDRFVGKLLRFSPEATHE
jgi:hypothetical protein